MSNSVTPWTEAYQASPSMGFSRQEYWSGLPFSFPGDHPHPGIEPGFPALEADALTSEPPGKPSVYLVYFKNLYQYLTVLYTKSFKVQIEQISAKNWLSAKFQIGTSKNKA